MNAGEPSRAETFRVDRPGPLRRRLRELRMYGGAPPGCVVFLLFLGFPVLVGLFAALLYYLFVSPIVPFVGAVIVTAALLVVPRLQRAKSSSVVVGVDGLLLRSGRRERFVSFERVRRVSRGIHGVKVHTGDRREIFLGDDRGGRLLEVAAGRLEEFRRATRQARRLESTEQALATAPSFLDVGRGYRAPGVSREELEALAADVSAPLSLRAAAALAIDGLGGEGTAQLRIAAGCFVEPGVAALTHEIVDAAPQERQGLIEAIAEVEMAASAKPEK